MVGGGGARRGARGGDAEAEGGGGLLLTGTVRTTQRRRPAPSHSKSWVLCVSLLSVRPRFFHERYVQSQR